MRRLTKERHHIKREAYDLILRSSAEESHEEMESGSDWRRHMSDWEEIGREKNVISIESRGSRERDMSVTPLMYTRKRRGQGLNPGGPQRKQVGRGR